MFRYHHQLTSKCVGIGSETMCMSVLLFNAEHGAPYYIMCAPQKNGATRRSGGGYVSGSWTTERL